MLEEKRDYLTYTRLAMLDDPGPARDALTVLEWSLKLTIKAGEKE
jgi:hypothetical protein